jgi:hypothetical protein
MVVVKRLRGVEVRVGDEAPEGWLPAGATRPLRTPLRVVTLDLEILDDGDGFVLAWTGPTPNDCNDTWHDSIGGALGEAQRRFYSTSRRRVGSGGRSPDPPFHVLGFCWLYGSAAEVAGVTDASRA